MKRYPLSPVLIIVISVLLYANTLGNGFVYDDEEIVVNNRFIRDLHNIPYLAGKNYFSLSGEESYRPIATLTYFADHAVFRLKPWGYHLTNLLLHAVNSVLLFIFLILFLRGKGQGVQAGQPLIASLIFATHPILTEAVNAVSFREDLLVSLFFMATLILYVILRYKIRSGIIPLVYLLSCSTYLLALFSKEMAVTLPLIILSYEWIANGRKGMAVFNKYNIGYIGVTLFYIVLRFYYMHNPIETWSSPWTLTERILTVPWLLLNYLKLTLFPLSLSVDYRISSVKSLFSVPFIVPFVIAASILGTVCRLWKKNKGAAFGALFFIITLVPVYNIIPIANPLAERYLYLPAVGFSIFVGATVIAFQRSEYLKIWPIYIAVLMIAIGIYSLTVVKRNTVWRDEYSLWSDVLNKQPDSSNAHYSLGRVYQKRGKLREAVREYNTALDFNPSNTFALNSIGLLYFEGGEYDEAVRAFKAAIRYYPYMPEYHFNLGRAYAKQFKYKEAIEEYKAALQLKPDYYDAFINLEIAKHYYSAFARPLEQDILDSSDSYERKGPINRQKYDKQ